VLTAALPRAESETFLITRDYAVATLAAANLYVAIRNSRALRCHSEASRVSLNMA
jgi:hypothetical protein